MEAKPHIAELLLEYAMNQGITVNQVKSGIQTLKIDEHWTAKLNGTQEKIDDIDGLSWYIEYNGWPAGMFSILGDGFMADGTHGNEDALREAIKAKMKS